VCTTKSCNKLIASQYKTICVTVWMTVCLTGLTVTVGGVTVCIRLEVGLGVCITLSVTVCTTLF